MGSSHTDEHHDGGIELSVKLDEPSLEPFPLDVDGNSVPIENRGSLHWEGLGKYIVSSLF